jgi:hypothetical protein
MISLVLLNAAVAAAVVGNVFDRRKHLDLHDVVYVSMGVNRTLADVA